MSLDYNYKQVKQGPPQGKIEEGTFKTLCFTMMAVGIGTVTEKNWMELLARIRMQERIYGALMVDNTPEGPKEVFFTSADIKRWFGLKLNVPYISKAAYLKRIGGELDRLQKQIMREEIREKQE